MSTEESDMQIKTAGRGLERRQALAAIYPDWDDIPTEDLVGILPINLRAGLPTDAQARRIMVLSLLKPLLEERMG